MTAADGKYPLNTSPTGEFCISDSSTEKQITTPNTIAATNHSNARIAPIDPSGL
jgi:hypothetical protein